jgi:hypothetical protein
MHTNMLRATLTVWQDSGGIAFDDYGGELEIHRLDFENASDYSSVLLGKAKTG